MSAQSLSADMPPGRSGSALTPLNLCTACGHDFGGITLFDRHRVGEYPQTGPADYRDRLTLGLVPKDEDWKPAFGRRCLDTEEMLAKGWHQDPKGRWRLPLQGTPPWR